MVESTTYVMLTDDNFEREVLRSPDPVLVDFWADWCGPCHIMAPVIEELAAQFKGRVRVGKLDVDRNPRAAERYGICSIPTLLVFKDGEKVDQVIGAVSKRELAARLEKLLEQAS